MEEGEGTPKYEPGKKYMVTARSSVQLLSIGQILHPPDTYTGVLDEKQLEEVMKSVNIGSLSIEVVDGSAEEAPIVKYPEEEEKTVPKEEPTEEPPKEVEESPVKEDEEVEEKEESDEEESKDEEE